MQGYSMLEAPYGDALVERLMFATRVIIGGTCAIDEDLMRLTVQNWARSAGMYTYLPTSIDRDLPAATDPEETVPINLIDALEDNGATADHEDVSPSSRQLHELQPASPSAIVQTSCCTSRCAPAFFPAASVPAAFSARARVRASICSGWGRGGERVLGSEGGGGAAAGHPAPPSYHLPPVERPSRRPGHHCSPPH